MLLKTLMTLFCLISLQSHATEQSPQNDTEPGMKNSSSSSDDIANTVFKAYQVTTAKISPNGKFVGLIQGGGRFSQLVVLNTTTFKKNIILEDKFNDSIDITDYHWIDNESIIVEANVKGKGKALLLTKLVLNDFQVTSVNTKYLLDGVFIVDSLPNVKNKFVVGTWQDNKTSLYKLDITKNGMGGQFRSKYRLNKKAPDNTYWLTNTKGHVILGYGFNQSDKQNNVWLKNSKTKKWKVVWKGDEDVSFQPVLVSRDHKILYVISNELDDLKNLYKYDLVEQKYLEKIYGDDSADINSAIISSDKERVLGISFIQDGFLQHIYFTEIDKILDKSLKVSVDESKPYIIDYSLDKSIAIVQTSSSTDPGTYHLFKANSMELIKFSSKAPWLNKYKFGTSQVITSKSIDGQDIESYLTLPYSKNNNLPPLIVLPHGGPISVRDTRHYNSHVQYLSLLGYAVLQPNYRGSSGYGKEFKKQGMQQWGRLIEDDILSGVDEVIKQGLVNSNKICIYGISYGGYSALISAINRPDIFKCAASYAGVTDLPLLFTDIKLSKSSRLMNLRKKIVGDPKTEMDTLIKFSPVYQAKKLTIPIFLAQGDKDSVVDIEHFLRMKKLLDIYDKKYDDMLLKGEGHGFKYLSSITSFYVELDSFFRRSLDLPEF